jgi:hypothetical protein
MPAQVRQRVFTAEFDKTLGDRAEIRVFVGFNAEFLVAAAIFA